MTGSATGLYPGGSLPLIVTVSNPQPFAIDVTSVDVTVEDASADCPASYVRAQPFTGTKIVRRSADADLTLSVEMLTTAPDACQGATFPLKLTGTATDVTPRTIHADIREIEADGWINIEESDGGRDMVVRADVSMDDGDDVALDVTITDDRGHTLAPDPISVSSSQTRGLTHADVRGLGDVPFTVGLRGVSTYGFTYEATIHAALDIHRPTVTIDAPSLIAVLAVPRAVGGAGAQISGTAADNIGVGHVVVYFQPRLAFTAGRVGPFGARLAGPAANRTWVANGDAGPGLWDVEAIAYDEARNISAVATRTVLIV
jgi:hypothetical protein